MEKNTPYLLMLMAGLLLGRFISFQHLKIVEITTLSILTFCHRGEILTAIQRLATRPQVRAYVVPRYSKAHQHVVSFGLTKIAFAAGILFGGLLLVLDALHRTAH
jgi:hypothetical protein